jgi:sodium-dependent dicarboxylate transporter 2/3/5
LNFKNIGFWGGIALFLLFLFLPPPEGLTSIGMRTAGVVLLMALWWISDSVHLAVTALVPLVLFPMLGIMKSPNVAAIYSNHLVYLYFGGFVIALAMEKCNLHKRVALLTIRRIGTKPDTLMLGFMSITAALGLWISNTAITMMMLPVALAVVNQLADSVVIPGVSPEKTPTLFRSTFGGALLLGVAYSASISGIGTIIGTPTNVAFLGYMGQRFPELPTVSFLDWMLIGIPLVCLFVPITWGYLCRFGSSVRISTMRFTSSASVIDEEFASLGPMKPEEKRVLFAACSTALLWIFRQDIQLGSFRIPGWSGLLPFPDYISDATVAMTFAILLCVWPASKNAESRGGSSSALIDWNTIQHGIPWGVVLLFGGGFALASGLEVSGLATWIGENFSKLRGVPIWVLFPIACAFALIITEMASNVATVLMISPILAEAAVQLGVDPYLLMMPAALVCSFGFMLPVATPPNAIVFSSGWITVSRMARVGLALDLIALALIPVLVYLLGRLVL